MNATADPLVLDFVEWVAREPRSYAEVIAVTEGGERLLRSNGR